jgi:deoxyribodipyrimidine photolyase-related protein
MPKSVFLLFPNQLFSIESGISADTELWFIEDHLFFKQYDFHRKKLAFHRSTMQYYAEKMRSKGFYTQYFKHHEADLQTIFSRLGGIGLAVQVYDPVDFLLEKRIKRFAVQFGVELIWHENPGFINSKAQNEKLLPPNTQRFFLADFYKKQRIQLSILLEPDSTPMGGRWSFDTENRKALPKDHVLPEFPKYSSKWAELAEQEILEEFPNNPGEVSLENYPITTEQAEEALNFFINNCLARFGPYQDAFSKTSTFVYHSNLSTAINAGLLCPKSVLTKVLQAYENGFVSIESAEGYIRQLIGWREFIRVVYERKGVKQRTTNFMQHQNILNWSHYQENSLMKVLFQKIEKEAYAHHIERLMLLGNFFFLSEMHPDQVYQFFMENFMDAYDWVMVPNVYGMSQFADGGLMTTKPYFSSSNYLKNQGLKLDTESAALFDALFWHFVDKHQVFLKKNMRTAQMVANWNRLSGEKKAAHLERAALNFQTVKSLIA